LEVDKLSAEVRRAGDGKGELVAWESGTYAVVFDRGGESTCTVAGLPEPETVPEAWTVTFQEDRGTPTGQVAFDRLVSWTERVDHVELCASQEPDLLSHLRVQHGC